MYVTDTHGFLWFLTEDNRLGKNARKIFKLCDSGQEIIVIPSIVLLECLYICEKKKVNIEFKEIIEKISESLNYIIYPLNEEIILECYVMSEIGDLHDRVIVASAKILNAKLITKDEKIKRLKIIETIW